MVYPKTMMFIGAFVIVLIVISIMVMNKENYDLRFNEKEVSIELQYQPSLYDAVSKLNREKIKKFVMGETNVTRVHFRTNKIPTNTETRFMAHLVISSKHRSLRVPIASTVWYNTQNLTTEDVENCIVQNPRVVHALKAVVF